jgi:hypothetical protein
MRIHALDAGRSGWTAAPCSASCRSRSGSGASRPTSATASRWPCAACSSRRRTRSCSSTTAPATRNRRSSSTSTASTTRRPTGPRDAPRGGAARSRLQPDDVDIVIDTHLHFDHAGGNTRRATDGGCRAGVPACALRRAARRVRVGALRNERIQASYLPHNFDPVMEAGPFELVDGDVEVVPGIACCGRRATRRTTSRC